MRYLEVADTLRSRLAAGDLGAGGALPGEVALAAQLGVSRVTVRRALELLRAEGLVTSRQGAGWFAAVDPVRQPLGRVTTIEAAIEEAGARPERRILSFGFEPVPAAVAGALGLRRGDDALRVRRLELADGVPFALVTVWVPGDLGADLSRADVAHSPFFHLLPLRGVDLGGATQYIDADAATRDDARVLGVATGAPVLVLRRVTRTRGGRPVLHSEHRYPAGRTAFEIEYPSVGFADPTPLGARHGAHA